MDLAASDSGRHRRSGAAPDAIARARNRRRRICAWPAAWRSIASRTARCCATGRFKHIWIQPASGDAGGALGAALPPSISFSTSRAQSERATAWRALTSGPMFAERESSSACAAAGAGLSKSSDDQSLIRPCATARRTAKPSAGSRAGWSSARARWAPAPSSATRARRTMQSVLNLKVKYPRIVPAVRAVACLREDVARVVRARRRQPLHAAGRRRGEAAAARDDRGGAGAVRNRQAQRAALGHSGRDSRGLFGAHPDRASRNQPALSRSDFARSRHRTGCPVLVNTSFNVRGEPIVCTPEDAFRCFMGTEIEVLAVGNCFLRKEDQDRSLERDYKTSFPPD